MSSVETGPNRQANTESTPLLTIGQYKVIGHVATGGMADVFKAENQNSGRLVAVKLPLNQRAAEILQNEIALHTECSSYPGIVPVDGSGMWQNRPWLATPLMEKGTLGDDLMNTTMKRSTGWITDVISELDQEIMEADTYMSRSIDQQDVVNMVNALYQQGVTNLFTETRDTNAQSIVEAVVGAASELGHDFDSDSPFVKETAKRLLVKEAARQSQSPDKNTVKRINILKGVADGVAALRQNGYVHGDIKPVNIGITSIRVDGTDKYQGKLFDFGMSSRNPVNDPSTVRGTYGTIPIEGYRGEVTTAGDMFALSVTAYRTLTGIWPHRLGATDQERINNLRYGIPVAVSDKNPDVSDAVSRVIMKGLSNYPTERGEPAYMRDVLGAHC